MSPNWSESPVLHGRIGEYTTIARRKKDSKEGYLGSTTNATARTLTIPLDVLDDGQTYVAHVFEDTPTSDYKDNPHAYRIRRGLVTARDTIEAALARSGGQAVILEPAGEEYEALA